MDAVALPPRPDLAQYRKQAKDLLRAAKAGDADALQRIRQCPRLGPAGAAAGATGDPSAEPPAPAPMLADAQYVVAREHGFAGWPAFAAHVEALAFRDAPIARFEAAADAVVAGDLPALARLVGEDPALARARSTRVHRATLLHYVAANGVEDYRQRTPPNAVAVARTLLAAGAAVDASADVYGGGPSQTPLGLLVSSVHPARAGLQAALVDVLVDHGASVEGPEDDGSPLLTALAFHYAAAAAALVRRGARVDSLAAAAGVGDDSRVRSLLTGGTDGGAGRRAAARALPRWLRLPRAPAAARAAERTGALGWAAALGHRRVVELLADAGVPLDGADAQGFTALHWAAWGGHLDVIDALVARGAPLEARNRYGGTVLGATAWAAAHGGRALEDPRPDALPSVDYPRVVAHLLAAGARADAVTLPSGHAGVDAVLAQRTSQE
ncbi:hypothetical protein tb265_40130 [Gemmatimonadetes bacterium T265]|nr:hypothetical protein tb265_40130 [Gemmatimonadetes bacterium T265]